MNRAYQLHLEQIQQHKRKYQETSQATEVIQILDPDLSCQLYFPATNLHRTYRGFWSWY